MEWKGEWDDVPGSNRLSELPKPTTPSPSLWRKKVEWGKEGKAVEELTAYSQPINVYRQHVEHTTHDDTTRDVQ